MTTAEFPVVNDDFPTPGGTARCTTCDRVMTEGQPYEIKHMGFRDRGPGQPPAELTTITCVYCPAPDEVCEGALDYFANLGREGGDNE